MFQIDGLVSGLDTTAIIDALLQSYQARIDLLQAQKQEAVDEQTAFKTMEANLIALRSALVPLSSSVNNVFEQKTATVSDETALEVAVSRSATPGSYVFKALQLAQNQQIATQGFAAPSSRITQGTLTIQVGSNAPVTITIDSTNDTLQGLADAINAAGAGVQASIIHDGSPSTTAPYRLLLSAIDSGTENVITVTNNLAPDSGGAIRPEFSGTYIGDAVKGASFAGTSTPTSNRGANNYTGPDNDTYTFTVRTGGTVGVDNGITIDYTDGSGDNVGTITVNATDVDTFLPVAEGLQIKFSAGTLQAGDTFTVDVYVSELQSPQNARLSIGSGPGALIVESPSNTFDSVLPGLTINLLKADPNRELTVSVSPDKEAITSAIEEFVASFNELMDFIDEQLFYDPETGEEGPLVGEFAAIDIQERIRSLVVEPVTGLSSGLRVLSSVGLRLEDTGKLSFDSSVLDDIIEGRNSTYTLEDVQRLFGLYGESSNPGIRFITGSSRTVPSDTPYEVDIIQVAEQATITATNAVTGTVTISATNNTFQIRVDGRDSNVLTIPDGTYTLAQLAPILEDLINKDDNIAPARVSVSVVGDQLQITSERYGLDSEVTILGGTSLSSLGFDGTETDTGKDVAGSFIVNGVTEPAVGKGQILTAEDSNQYTAGIQLRVTLTPSQVQPGVDATLHVTSGVANNLVNLLSDLLDPVDGRLKRINDRYNDEIEDIEETIAEQEKRRDAEREALIRKFATLETILSDLQNVNAMLTAQLAGLVGS